MTLEWRNWLSHRLLQGYYAERSFYTLGQQRSIDNPDQVSLLLLLHRSLTQATTELTDKG